MLALCCHYRAKIRMLQRFACSLTLPRDDYLRLQVTSLSGIDCMMLLPILKRVSEQSKLKRIITIIWFLFCGKAERLFSFFHIPFFGTRDQNVMKSSSGHVQSFRGRVQLNNSSSLLQQRASLQFRFVRSPSALRWISNL